MRLLRLWMTSPAVVDCSEETQRDLGYRAQGP